MYSLLKDKKTELKDWLILLFKTLPEIKFVGALPPQAFVSVVTGVRRLRTLSVVHQYSYRTTATLYSLASLKD